MSESDANKGGQHSLAKKRALKLKPMRSLVAIFAATVLLCIFVASYVANSIVIVLLVLMTLLLVYAFGAKVLPTSGAALVLTLPVLGGVAILCHTLWNVHRSHSTPGKGVILLPPQDWLFVLLCLFPYFLASAMALLILVRHDYRRCVLLEPGKVPSQDTGGESTADAHKQKSLWDQIEVEWDFERNRFSAIEAAAAQQSFMYGAVTSLTLIVCAVLIAPMALHPESEPKMIELGAIGVASATASSFLLNGGRIMVRVASQETSSRMFAWASKLQLVSALAGALLGMLVANQIIHLPGKEVSAAVIGGLLIGFLGGRAIQAIVESAAASLSGVKIPKTELEEVDLKKLDGVDVDDLERFIEEGITSIHDLAKTPTPRLYFNTQYSLQMICDWQSQAILFDKLQDSTQTFRIAHGVRGAIDAVRIFEESPGCQNAGTPRQPVDKSPSTDPATERAEAKIREEVVLAKRLLCNDETIEKLKLYRSAQLRISTEEPACSELKKLLVGNARVDGRQCNQQHQHVSR